MGDLIWTPCGLFRVVGDEGWKFCRAASLVEPSTNIKSASQTWPQPPHHLPDWGLYFPPSSAHQDTHAPRSPNKQLRWSEQGIPTRLPSHPPRPPPRPEPAQIFKNQNNPDFFPTTALSAQFRVFVLFCFHLCIGLRGKGERKQSLRIQSCRRRNKESNCK